MGVFSYILKYGLSKLACFVSSLLDSLMSVIPDCPFEKFISYSDEMDIIGFINYFIAFDSLVVILQSWLFFVMVYLAYRVLAGTVKDVPFVGSLATTLFK